MEGPGEIVSGIFSATVVLVVLLLLFGAFRGWDISAISQLISSFAVPFVISLVIFSFILQIANKLA